MYHSIRLPACDGVPNEPARIIADIDEWARCAPIADLVELFGGKVPQGNLEAVLEYLEDFSAQHWDFRNGAERNLAVRQEFTAQDAALINKVAHALGLVNPEPARHNDYSHVVVLGGLVRTCLERVRFAAQLFDQGICTGQVSAIGGFRPINEDEAKLAIQVGIQPCRYEIDAMAAGVCWAFGVSDPVTIETSGSPEVDPNRAWCVKTYAAERAMVHVVAAPSSRPDERRANTADTCKFWGDEVVKLGVTDRVLIVTSSIYVPFQHCDAIANIGLRFGCGVDTVGIDLAGSNDCQQRASDIYLQEIRSTVRAMRQLHLQALAT